MSELSGLGRLLLMIGGAIVLMGLALMLASRLRLLGHLPGDITFRRGNVTVHLPIVTSLVLSVVLTVILNVIAKLFRR